MPQLIQVGKLYRAVPPLYSIPKKGGKKGENEYFIDNIEFVRYVHKIFLKNNDLRNLDDTPISSKDLSVLFLTNQDYTYYINSAATTYAVEPLLLEYALFNHYNKISVSALRKDIAKKYRFMEVSHRNNTVIYEGIINDSNSLFMNDNLFADCKQIIKIMESNKGGFYYKMNGKVCSIYEIMKAFESTQPSHIQRYKGLGEMQAYQIAESVLLPTSNRTLIQYTVQDVKETIEIIDSYESDFTKLFKFVGEVTRQDLLD